MESVKGFFAGSGIDIFGEVEVVDRVLSLTGFFDDKKKKLTAPLRVAYIGTATYDIPFYRNKQTKWFIARGCTICDVCVADASYCTDNYHTSLLFLGTAHVVLVSSGNALFAIQRWEETGLDACLRAVALRGAVLAGGSAGALCWFTSGHCESTQPALHASTMLQQARCEFEEQVDISSDDAITLRTQRNNAMTQAEVIKGKKEDNQEEKAKKSWNYIRVHGLGVLPGMLCPHHNRRESNGMLLEENFNCMLKRHPTERGIGIDHWAALVLPGDGTYEVFAVVNKIRGADGTLRCSVFVKDVVHGEVRVTAAPTKGRLEDLLRQPDGPLVRDPFEMFCAMTNQTAMTDILLCHSR